MLAEIRTLEELAVKVKEGLDEGNLPVRTVFRVVERRTGESEVSLSKEFHGVRVGWEKGPDGPVFVIDSAVVADY